MSKSLFPTITLRDNRFGDSALAFEPNDNGKGFVSRDAHNEGLGGQQITGDIPNVLETFGKLSLDKLADLSNGSLVDLTPNSHLDDDERKNLRFFSFVEADAGEEEKKKGKTVSSFRLDTGNLMGVLRFRSEDRKTTVQVKVLSRFDRGAKNYFLNYLLSKAFDVSLGTEEVSSNPASILDNLLDLLFVRRLADAVGRLGLFKQYRERRNNDWNFKGRLDLPRHLRENLPLQHGIAYVKREIEHDVPLNEMILLAAKVVRKRRGDIFDRNEGARKALRDLLVAVPNPGTVRDVLRERTCREPVSQPYYREAYEPLRQVAKMILEKEQWSLFADDGDAEVSGVVFDGSWLWEEYVATVLVDNGFRHGTEPVLRVFSGKSKRFIPDFYHLDGSGEQGCDIVLDAKYKRSNPAGQREDVHQVLCYLLLSGAKRGGLVFPPRQENDGPKYDSEDNTYDEKKDGGWSSELDIDSPYSKTVPIKWSCFSWAPIKEENTASWDAFCKYMEKQEEDLLKRLQGDYHAE